VHGFKAAHAQPFSFNCLALHVHKSTNFSNQKLFKVIQNAQNILFLVIQFWKMLSIWVGLNGAYEKSPLLQTTEKNGEADKIFAVIEISSPTTAVYRRTFYLHHRRKKN
jgi:hypothetical protein